MLARLALAVALGSVLVVAIPGPGGAHSEEGVFSGLSAEPAEEPLDVAVRARLLYADDNHPASGATVTAGAVSSDGAAAASVPLSDNGDGTYEGTLTLPAAGNWTIEFSATNPDAAGQVVYVASTATTRTTATASSPPPARPSDGGGDGGANTALVVGAIVGAVVVGSGVVAVVVWRRRGAP